ncbi:DNA polymerase III subunit gamma/tau [bacterium]|nr:DNA polymerase III subunit gamma/tau [bacterium]
MADSPSKDSPDVPGSDDATGSLFGDAPAAATYQVLARKYRPTRFEDLVGQEAMVRTLAAAFRTGRIAHAFMLTGVRGVGKTTTARLLARALNYQTDAAAGPSMSLDPPGVHCSAIMASSHPDVLELDAASRTGVADMRELLDGVRYAPVSARFKVYIIDEVHMLSTPAFNALLKTLEEPPAHVKFIFATTEIRRVPVTVLSRCQRFNLQRFTPETLASHLASVCEKEGASVDPAALALIARAAEGSARDGLSILDQAIVQGEAGKVTLEQVRDMLGLADRSRMLDLFDQVLNADHKSALAETSELIGAGADGPTLIKDLMDIVVEVSRAEALKADYRFAGPADWGDRIRAMADRVSAAQASRMWRLLLEGFADCARAPDPAIAAEMVVLRLAAVAALPTPEDAVRLLTRGDGPGHSSAHLSGEASGANASKSERPAPSGGGSAQTQLTSPAPTGGARVIQARLQSAEPEAQEGPWLQSLQDIMDELEARRQFDLLYDVSNFVRPSEVRYGVLRFAAAERAPADLLVRLKDWLETATGVEWEVSITASGAESDAELRKRRRLERIAEAERHPRVAEALKLFPGARVVSVEAPSNDAAELDEAAPAGASSISSDRVVRVDFEAKRRRPAVDPGSSPPSTVREPPPGSYVADPEEPDEDEDE